MRRPIDILCAGELLVDFVPAETPSPSGGTSMYHRIPGGSPANLSTLMARLGNRAFLAACVGNDAMGTFLRESLRQNGVDTTYIAQVDEPTTLLLYSETSRANGYQVYRGADALLSIRQFPYSRFEEIAILHTTCFGLSKSPAQQVILEAAEKAKRAGCLLTIDVNYQHKIWPERREAQRLIAELCRLGALVKVSSDDWAQLYESDVPAAEAVIEHFLKMGAKEVCYTIGSEGSWVGSDAGCHHLPVVPRPLKAPYGVGDAFWAGYLTARIEGKKLPECAKAGNRMAEMLFEGPLPAQIDRSLLFDE